MKPCLIVALLTLAACSNAQLRAHTAAAVTSRISLDLGATVGEEACSEERSAQMGREGVSVEDHEAHVARCVEARGAHRLAVQGWTAYVTSVLEAAASGRRPDLTDVGRWALELVRLYRGVSGALRDLGVEAPALPGFLGGAR